MGCGTKLASIILLVFTVIFLLIGLALLGVGIWMLVSQDKLFYVLNMVSDRAGGGSEASEELTRISQQKGVVNTAGAVMVAAGVVSAVISAFGCMGTIKQSKCLLGVYAGILGVLLSGQITVAVLTIMYKNTAINFATEQLLNLQDRYLISVNEFPVAKKQPESAVSLAFNYMFVSLQCCGVNSTADASLSSSWAKSNRTWLNKGNMTIPATCCPVHDHYRTRLLTESRWDLLGELLKRNDCPVDMEGMNTAPCVGALLSLVERYSLWILIGSIAFGASQLLVILFTTCLMCNISKS